jgi:hypothetical protein
MSEMLGVPLTLRDKVVDQKEYILILEQEIDLLKGDSYEDLPSRRVLQQEVDRLKGLIAGSPWDASPASLCKEVK